MSSDKKTLSPDTENKKTNLKKNEFFELLRFALVTLAIVIPIRMFIAQPFVVNGESMLPTFNNGDYLIIDEISYRSKEPERGEVIVFRFPTEQTRFLIKRVIGLPGESIIMNGDKVSITKKDGEVIDLKEAYTNGDFSEYGSWELGENQYFVLGDNRNASSDSPDWGLLERKYIVGKTFLRLFPFSKIDLRPGQAEAEEFEIIRN